MTVVVHPPCVQAIVFASPAAVDTAEIENVPSDVSRSADEYVHDPVVGKVAY